MNCDRCGHMLTNRAAQTIAMIVALFATIASLCGCRDTSTPEQDAVATNPIDSAKPTKAENSASQPDQSPAASKTVSKPEDFDVSPAPVDSGESYAALLSELVTDAGLVRYQLLEDSSRSAQLLEIVEAFAQRELPTDPNEKLAFWCNAYNANVLHMAFIEQGKPGFESVVKVPGFFDERMIAVAQKELTLNDLENRRIRPLGDARIHAALVCAAMSCPPLRNEPYAAQKLDAQLDDQCARWVNDPRKFRMENGMIGLSEILGWYGEDFQKPPFGNFLGFVLAYANPNNPLRTAIVSDPRPGTVWLPYDWSLNEASSEEPEL